MTDAAMQQRLQVSIARTVGPYISWDGINEQGSHATGSGSTAVLALLVAMSLSSCTRIYPPATAAEVLTPTLSLPDELRAIVIHLAADIGERNCYHPAKLAQAADWIESEFQAMGYATRRVPVHVSAGEPYRCGEQTAWNIEADHPGADRADEIIVIGAHYDSKVAMADWHADGPPTPWNPGTPGADDNASGVAGVLAVARMLKDVPSSRTVKFVAFANEEPPFFQTAAMGSLAYAQTLAGECKVEPRRKITGMISFEMLGYYAASEQRKRPFGIGALGLPAKADYIAFLGNWTSVKFAANCGGAFSRHAPMTLRVARIPLVIQSLAWSDDWSFWQIGVPAIAATDTAFLRNDHYHDVTDTPDTLDYDTMADAVCGLRFVVEELGNGS